MPSRKWGWGGFVPPRRTKNRACRPGGPNLPRPRRTKHATSAMGVRAAFRPRHEGLQRIKVGPDVFPLGFFGVLFQALEPFRILVEGGYPYAAETRIVGHDNAATGLFR